jgi:hypothetical protein
VGSFAVAPAAKSYLSGAANFFFVGLGNFQVPKTANTTCCITIESAKENGQDLKLFDRFHSSFLLHCGEFFCFQESES